MSKFRGAGKWKPESPARTNTGSSIRGKISAPILRDDDEFPVRVPGTGIATPLGTEGPETQLRSSAASGLALQQITANGIGDSTRMAPIPPQPSYDPPPPPTNQASDLRNSIGSMPSRSSEGKPQRKKSSLRSVFGKLFGKKRKNSASLTKGKGPGGVRAGQHRSDPTALTRSPKGTTNFQQRAASLPINEFNRGLRSHSTVTDDFPLQNGSNQESIIADGQTRPRRATTPSRLWTPNKTPGYVDWTGLSPRPASIHGRGSHVTSGDELDGAVGIAVTSGSHPNRRSRSLGELRRGAPASTTERRRSDEIRYWRESYDPGLLSPMSSNKAETEEPILLDLPELPRDEEPQEQPQPFNFGPMGEMAGMKITQAASLETRVQRLEDRLRGMEEAVSQMHRRAAGDPLVFQDPPHRSSKRDRSSSINRPKTDNSEIALPKQPRYRETQPQQEAGQRCSQKRSSSYGSSRPSTVSTQTSYQPSFENFSHPTYPTSDEQMPLNSTQTVLRPLSTSTTIRGMPSSSPTISKDTSLTGEHYTVLTNMILAEQAARQHLEAVVQNLHQQLQDLRSSSVGSYPTLKSDQLTDPMKEGGVGEFSTFEQDDSSDDEGRYARDDVFQTPEEERGNFSDDIFGDFNGGDLMSVPRTMSLSQMTLGKALNRV